MSMDIYKAHLEWLQQLKPGDVVDRFVHSIRKPSRTQGKVLRLTNTMIVLTNGQRYRKANGSIVGDDCGDYSLRNPARRESHEQV